VLVLSNAKIIHCRRDPVDNCLSIFKQNFLGWHGYAYDLIELGGYYRLYQDLMAHWHTCCQVLCWILTMRRWLGTKRGRPGVCWSSAISPGTITVSSSISMSGRLERQAIPKCARRYTLSRSIFGKIMRSSLNR